jgi:hypothetical protein
MRTEDEKMNKRCNGSYGSSRIQLRAPAGNNIIDSISEV